MNISGVCKACIGSWGKDCKHSCLYGYYGHGCREKCNCSEYQTCDKRYGCQDNQTNIHKRTSAIEDISGITISVVCVVLTVIVFGSLLYIKQKSGQIRKPVEPLATGAHSGCDRLAGGAYSSMAPNPTFNENKDSIQNEQEDLTYSDIRESFLPGDPISEYLYCSPLPHAHSEIPARYENEREEKFTYSSSSARYENEREEKFTYSISSAKYENERGEEFTYPSSLEVNEYSGCSESSGIYNCLKFEKKSPSTAQSAAAQNVYFSMRSNFR
ncbi:uncharacterized protein LOC134263248 [Saccostrea cucullata]|uniref:uncharacterized protein LOC134263248 n=1 Tax=Saccostrea cuccullata TaxID=36930 RepID=UPI002ED34966